MQNIKEHIIYKALTIVLVLSLLTPTLVKIGHVFENHKHEVCTSKHQKHLHELNLDCEFYKFKLSNSFDFKVSNFELFSVEENYKNFYSQYQFVSEFQKLSYLLRGPPQFV